MDNKYSQAFNSLVLMLSGGLRIEYLENETIKNDLETLQELINICSNLTSIKHKIDHIQDAIDSCYDIDDKEWKQEVEQADEELSDIKLSYAFRVEDTRIIKELKDLLGCQEDNLVKKVKELDKALDITIEYAEHKRTLYQVEGYSLKETVMNEAKEELENAK